MCKDAFGAAFTPEVQQAAVDGKNVRFGGLKYSATNVFFSYGTGDPWYIAKNIQIINKILKCLQ